MAMILSKSRLRLTQAKFFGSSTGAGSVTQLTQGFGITATPNPINSIGTIALASPLSADWNVGAVNVNSLNSTKWVNPVALGADPTGVADSTAAINAAFALAGSGGHVEFPNGTYLTTSPLLAEGYRGLTISGSIGQYGFNGVRIIGSHTGKAILSMIGSLFCEVRGITLEGDTPTSPKTGLLLGRSAGGANAGDHNFYGVDVQGFYSVAGVYNIASEQNNWYGCYLSPNSADFAGVYMCQSDGVIATIGGLTASSMEANYFYGCAIGNYGSVAGSAGLWIDCDSSTGHIHVYGAQFLMTVGASGDAFVKMRLGVGGAVGDTEFPIGLHDCLGEGTPTNGIHISSTTTRILSGFTATNIRLQTPTTNNILCDGAGSVYLVGPNISTAYLGVGAKPSTFHRIDGGTLNLFGDSTVTIGRLTASTLNCSDANPTITTNTNNVIRDVAGVANRFSGPVNIEGKLALQEIGITLVNGANQNIPLPANSFVKISGPTGAFSIGGIVAPAANGQIIRFWNNTNFVLTIKYADAGSAAANQIVNVTGLDIVLGGSIYGWFEVQYSVTLSRWIVVGHS